MRYSIEDTSYEDNFGNYEESHRAVYNDGKEQRLGQWLDRYTACSELLEWMSRDKTLTEEENEMGIAMYEYVNDL